MGDEKRQMNFVERMIGRETPDFRFSSFSDWWNEVADVRTDSFDWWYVTGVSAFLVLYWLLFIVGVIQLACDSRRGGKLRRAEEEAEQRNRRQMRTAKKRVRFSPVTDIQMAPLEEDDEDSEDEEATPLDTTVIQMSTLEEDQSSE